jgi:N-acetylglutamate synthase
MNTKYKIKPVTLKRYAELIAFWNSIEGIHVSDDDKYDRLELFLKRNPGLNFIVLDNDKIIGTIKSSHDGSEIGAYYHIVSTYG